jgi:hypothetical protein
MLVIEEMVLSINFVIISRNSSHPRKNEIHTVFSKLKYAKLMSGRNTCSSYYPPWEESQKFMWLTKTLYAFIVSPSF